MENKGQVADDKGNLQPEILFTANSVGAKVYLTANSIHYQFTKTEYPEGYDPHKKPVTDPEKEKVLKKQIKTSTHRFTLELQGVNLHPKVSTEKQSSYFENYYIAQCPNGITGVHGYEKIIYKNVYPKIDWVIYSKGGFMEYDFLVHPGGDAATIKLKVKDADSININAAGELVMKTILGEVKEKAPVSYADGSLISSHLKQNNDGTIGFDVQPYAGKELRIDPSVVWATYYGGNDIEGQDVACKADGNGNVYLASNTSSLTGISSSGGFQTSFGGASNDAFLVKFDNNGTRLWATYYGGSGYDYGQSVATDNNGNVYLAGYTSSNNIIASGGFQNSNGGSTDLFIVKFTNSGIRIWGSYYGGNGAEMTAYCCVDANGNAYLSGTTASSNNIASGGFQNTLTATGTLPQDAFLVKFNSSGNRLWCTYYGGDYLEKGNSCSTDGNGNVYLVGRTNSASGIASGGFQNVLVNGLLNTDAFLVKFDGNGNRLWATYYGGLSSEEAYTCATDIQGNVFLAGSTSSTTDIAFNGFQSTYNGNYDGFLVKFNPSGSRLWSTYLGGDKLGFIHGCAVDANGDIFITGYTNSVSNIAYSGFQNNYQGGGQDTFIAKISSSGNRIWSSYFGGSSTDLGLGCATDNLGNIFISGYTSSVSGIAFNGFQNTYGGGSTDAFLTKIGIACIDPTVPTVSATPGIICSGSSAMLHINSGSLNNAAYWQWRKDSCNGTLVDTGTSIIVMLTTTTTYYVRGEGGCTTPGVCATITITVKPGPVASFSISDSIGCGSLPVSFYNTTQNAATLQWNFGDGTSTADSLPPPHTYLPGNYTVFLKAENGICSSMVSKTIRVIRSPVAAFTISPNINTPIQLSGASFQFTNASQNAGSYLWKFSNTDSSLLQNPIHTFATTGNYYVQLYAYNSGCADSVTVGPIIIIDDIPLQIPNAFSPNKDGVNDTWIITGLQGNPNVEVTVFNRWGQHVLTSTGYSTPWDGNYRSKPLPVDTYYYIITVNGKRFTGSVFLLR